MKFEEVGRMFLDATTPVDWGSLISGLFVFCLAVTFYFVPAIVAYGRHTINAGGVLVLNLFLGWTFIGWIVAFAMAAGGMTEQQLAARGPVQMVPQASAPLVSPDARSWWDGSAWRPLPPAPTSTQAALVISPDGGSWWDAKSGAWRPLPPAPASASNALAQRTLSDSSAPPNSPGELSI